jgi:hypothetical protein
MKRIIGIGIGLVIMVISVVALRAGQAGRVEGFDDIAFWWTVVGVLLGAAALSAIAGALIHSPRARD